MDKAEHAARLRRAIGTSGIHHSTIATAVNRNVRTVGNWVSEKKPTMPTEAERVILRSLVGPYDAPGDAVEAAITASELVEWRKDEVRSVYKRNLYEQRESSPRREEIS